MQLLNEIKTLINAEVIRALTPIFIAAVGGAIGITVVFVNPSGAGFGLATTAIAAAAGLAQPNKGLEQQDK